MQEYEHKPGYYITFGYGGNIVYKKISTGNKFRKLLMIQIDMSTLYDYQKEPLLKELNDDFIKINDSKEIESPMYEENRDLYKNIKKSILKKSI